MPTPAPRSTRPARPRPGRSARESKARSTSLPTRAEGRAPRRSRRLGRYADTRGCLREVVVQAGAAGSLLVVDRDAATGRDGRLVAHLAADEPRANAELICRSYLRAGAAAAGRCRRLTRADLTIDPTSLGTDAAAAWALGDRSVLVDPGGCEYTLQPIETGMSIPELRWRRRLGAAVEVVSLREVVARLESYEPACPITASALAGTVGSRETSSSVLRLELVRVQESPTVLNRRLRERVVATVAREETSMSEIAIRCGRVKRDGKGNVSGETSWLARRLGLLPEGGQSSPTPWIHTDVLALIARLGLGISPREVEL